MSEKFLTHIKIFIETTPICDPVSSFANKKKIKTIIKESEERIKFLDKFPDQKKVTPLLPILTDKISCLKSSAEKFENLFNELNQTKSLIQERKTKVEKQQKDELNIRKLRETLLDQIKSLKEKYIKIESELNAESLKYSEQKQAELDGEFNRASEMARERQSSLKENELLKEKKESILKDIQTQAELIDKDFADKKNDVSSLKTKNMNNFEDYKKELDKKSDYEIEKKEIDDFCELVKIDLNEIENKVQDYEKMFTNSMKDFERPLKKVEKIKKENGMLKTFNDETSRKVFHNNSSMMDLIATNTSLRKMIEKEEKQQTIFLKIIQDTETKLKK